MRAAAERVVFVMVAFALPSLNPNLLAAAETRKAHLAEGKIQAQYDALLVQRFTAGDNEAFAEIVARYREKMFAIAFERLRDRSDAEEIAADTFIRAHRGLANFRGESSLSTWLHRITVNLALNRYWHCFRRRRHLMQSMDMPLNESGPATFADRVATSAAGPEREAMTREFSDLLEVCAARLNPDQKEILRLRNHLNASYEQISATLGIRVGTVKSR